MSRDALVVGINTYDGLKCLNAPAADAEAIAQILQQYGGFQVTRLPAVKDKENQTIRIGKQTKVNLTQLEKAIVQLFKPDGKPPDTALVPTSTLPTSAMPSSAMPTSAVPETLLLIKLNLLIVGRMQNMTRIFEPSLVYHQNQLSEYFGLRFYFYPILQCNFPQTFFTLLIRLKVVLLRSYLRLWAKQKDLFVRASKAIARIGDCFAGNEFL